METKKNPSVDLTKKSGYYFSIGLLIAMSIVVTAFEWRYNESFISLRDKNQNEIEDPFVVIPTDLTPPPMPVAKKINITEVSDVDKVEDMPPMDLDPSETFASVEITPIMPEAEPSEELPFNFVEESASPKEGMQAFYKYVGEKIKYPAQARRMGIEGRVFVEFIINRDGSLSDVKAIKGIGAGCDEEAVRVIQSASAWNPGKQRGKAVRQRYTLPIIFKLG